VVSIEGVFMDRKEFEEFRKRVEEEMKRIKRERSIMSDKFTYKEEGENFSSSKAEERAGLVQG
jgi:hypothetical protein